MKQVGIDPRNDFSPFGAKPFLNSSPFGAAISKFKSGGICGLLKKQCIGEQINQNIF